MGNFWPIFLTFCFFLAVEADRKNDLQAWDPYFPVIVLTHRSILVSRKWFLLTRGRRKLCENQIPSNSYNFFSVKWRDWRKGISPKSRWQKRWKIRPSEMRPSIRRDRKRWGDVLITSIISSQKSTPASLLFINMTNSNLWRIFCSVIKGRKDLSVII